jgi:hypothetical protein
MRSGAGVTDSQWDGALECPISQFLEECFVVHCPVVEDALATTTIHHAVAVAFDVLWQESEM